MSPNQWELIEQTTFAMVVRALEDYWPEAIQIFREETDKAQDIAEDVVREAVDEMGLSTLKERLYGNVDFKKAIYVFLPEPCTVALMLDAKTEKDEGTATIQMSQTSMRIRFVNRKSGATIDERGNLAPLIVREGREYYVVTIVAKFVYDTRPDGGHDLRKIIACCIPNSKLQDQYNPNEHDTIWQVGRNAPTLGEDFRVRVNFTRLREKADWRVVTIPMLST